jgi:hypothetical protein
VLGEDALTLETPAGGWHAVLSLDEGGVIFEVKHGPYQPIAAADYAPCSPAAEAPTDHLSAILDWYAIARVGDVFPGI